MKRHKGQDFISCSWIILLMVFPFRSSVDLKISMGGNRERRAAQQLKQHNFDNSTQEKCRREFVTTRKMRHFCDDFGRLYASAKDSSCSLFIRLCPCVCFASCGDQLPNM